MQRRYGFMVDVEVKVNDGDGGVCGGGYDAFGSKPDSLISGMEL